MSRQAAKFGAEHEIALVETIDTRERPFPVHTSNGVRLARSVLIATGSSPKRLGAPGEKEYFTRGVSYCATCDGPLYGGKRLLLVGGGNTTVEEAIFLAGIADEVVLVHRRDQLRADAILQERLSRNAKITVLWNHVVSEILGDEGVTGARVRHVQTGVEQVVPADGIFISIGTTPRSDFLPGRSEADRVGAGGGGPGPDDERAGHLRRRRRRGGAYRQITFAVGDGTTPIAALCATSRKTRDPRGMQNAKCKMQNAKEAR